MDDDLVRGLQVMTAQLAVLTAAIHLAVVLPRFKAVSVSGVAPRSVSVLFVLGAVAILVGMVALRVGLVSHRTVYVLGVVVMLAQLVGWVLYHNVEAAGHSHGGVSIAQNTVEHFLSDPLEAAAKTAELGATTLLLVLLRVDPRVEPSADASLPEESEA